MKRALISILILATLLIFTTSYSQSTAELSYITSKGTAYLNTNPNMRLLKGQQLETTDVIVLENGAGVRIFFAELQRGEKYEAPDTVLIASEIKRLKSLPDSTDRLDRALAEVGKFFSQYLKPIYNRYAGTRGLEIFKSAMVHDKILTFRRQPEIVVRGVSQAQTISIFNSSGKKLTAISVSAGRGIRVVPVGTVKLNFGETYTWKLSGEKQTGEIRLVSAAEAAEIERIILAMETDALDKTEAAQSVATYLFDQGFWAEAYCYAQTGLEVDAENPLLQNLQQAILNLQPEDIAFQEAIKSSGELSLRYSFHIKKENRVQEIYDGSTVHSGDLMQIRCEASTDCYLFILNIDAGNKLYVLYPLENQDHFLAGGKEIVFPEQGKYFKADKQVGQEKLYLIAAKVPLDYLAGDLDKYFRAFTSSADNFAATRGLTEIRGFSKVVDEKGETVHEIKEGLQSFKLSRLLKGKGLVVKEIGFGHVE